MTEDDLTVTPLSATCGAEVEGVDLARLTDGQMADIRRLVAERGVVVVRDQELSPEQHIGFARRWGEIDYNRFFPIDPTPLGRSLPQSHTSGPLHQPTPGPQIYICFQSH